MNKRLNLVVAALMESRGWNQKETAEVSGVSQSAIGCVLRGKHKPQTETLDRLAAAFVVKPSTILAGMPVDEPVAEPAAEAARPAFLPGVIIELPPTFQADDPVWMPQRLHEATGHWSDRSDPLSLFDAVAVASAEADGGDSTRVLHLQSRLQIEFPAAVQQARLVDHG